MALVLNRAIQRLFFLLTVRPLVLVMLGLNVRHGARLPQRGPAVLVANHNSHLDTAVLMSLFPQGTLHRLRPVAAADYFLRNRFLAWFALNLMGIVPLDRRGPGRPADKFAACFEALDQGDILILFPEGTRGEPGHMSAFRHGVAFLAEARPEVPFIPIFISSLGKALPRDAWIPLPVFCDVFVGTPMAWTGEIKAFTEKLERRVRLLGGKAAA
jgi:1-acyl-sn-glycerol-3-phosphate acyltransferase